MTEELDIIEKLRKALKAVASQPCLPCGSYRRPECIICNARKALE